MIATLVMEKEDTAGLMPSGQRDTSDVLLLRGLHIY